MVHSIELLLDDRSEQLIRNQWRLLAEAGLPSEDRRHGAGLAPRPHVTLIACDSIESSRLGSIGEVVGEALPLPLVLGPPMVFGRVDERKPGLIVVRQVLPSVGLLELQQRVAAVCPPALDRHFDPGSWAPHVTIGHRYTPDQLGPAVRLLGTAELTGQAAGCRYWQGDLRQETLLV